MSPQAPGIGEKLTDKQPDSGLAPRAVISVGHINVDSRWRMQHMYPARPLVAFVDGTMQALNLKKCQRDAVYNSISS